MTPDLRQQLDALFTTVEEAPAHSHRPYRLTTLKRSLELMRPAAIRANMQDYTVLQALFTTGASRGAGPGLVRRTGALLRPLRGAGAGLSGAAAGR
ncbi:MAG: hypothetical protein WKG07_44805 [Hymenobacter sp.]